jgi:hypothetical protein
MADSNLYRARVSLINSLGRLGAPSPNYQVTVKTLYLSASFIKTSRHLLKLFSELYGVKMLLREVRSFDYQTPNGHKIKGITLIGSSEDIELLTVSIYDLLDRIDYLLNSLVTEQTKQELLSEVNSKLLELVEIRRLNPKSRVLSLDKQIAIKTFLAYSNIPMSPSRGVKYTTIERMRYSDFTSTKILKPNKFI